MMRRLLVAVVGLLCLALGSIGWAQANDVEAVTRDVDEQVTAVVPAAPRPMHIELKVAVKVEQIGGGITLFAGTIGNILSILVLRRPKLRYNSVSLYLTFLAWSDLTMLLLGQGGRHWIRSLTNYDPLKDSLFYCQFWQILVVSSVYSNYILAGVSFERCIAINFPLKARRFLTRKASKIYLAISLICAIAYRLHVFWTFKISIKNGDKSCGIDPMNYFAKEVRPWYDLVYKWGIPMVVIVISNIFIIKSLYKARALRGEMGAGGEGSKDQDQKLKSLAVMLVVVSITFIIMVSPVHLNYVVNASFEPGYSSMERKQSIQRLAFAIGITSVYLNHAINFFLYVISGGDFREEFKQMMSDWFSCFKSKPAMASSFSTQSTNISKPETTEKA